MRYLSGMLQRMHHSPLLLFSFLLLEYNTQTKSNLEKKLFHRRGHSPSLQETHGRRNPKQDPEAETMEECCLLACLQGLYIPSFLLQLGTPCPKNGAAQVS